MNLARRNGKRCDFFLANLFNSQMKMLAIIFLLAPKLGTFGRTPIDTWSDWQESAMKEPGEVAAYLTISGTIMSPFSTIYDSLLISTDAFGSTNYREHWNRVEREAVDSLVVGNFSNFLAAEISKIRELGAPYLLYSESGIVYAIARRDPDLLAKIRDNFLWTARNETAPVSFPFSLSR